MSRKVGARFEAAAADHLRARGWRVVATNFTCRGGEIDLVCEDGDTLVFVEVRARSSRDFGTPEETVSVTKQRRIIHAAQVFLTRHRAHDRNCRFDVVAIAGGQINHLVDAFQT